MRKVIFGTLSLLLLLCLAAVASAESVVRMPYTLVTAEYTRDGLYTGEAYNGVPDGFGLFESSTSENIRWHYVGYWMDGLMDGEGGTYWDDGVMEVGTYYMAEFVDGYAMDQGIKITNATPSTTAAQSILSIFVESNFYFCFRRSTVAEPAGTVTDMPSYPAAPFRL